LDGSGGRDGSGGTMDGSGPLGGAGGAVSIDVGTGGRGDGGDAAIVTGVDASTDAIRRFACGSEECVVGESYCRASVGGTGGTSGSDGGGVSGTGGSSGGPPGFCNPFPADCTTRLDCTCLCGSPACNGMTSQCDVSDGAVYYTLFNP
jgi:hypothetical protein